MKLPPMPLGLFMAAQLPLLAAETGPVRTGADLLPPIGAIGFTETDKAGKEAPNKDIAAVERLAQELERAKNQEKAKPKLAIVDIAVSVEGIPRPDLGLP